MSAPMPAVTAPVAETAGAYIHFENGMIDEDVLKEVAAFLHRTHNWALTRSKAVALWVSELIIYRDARGVLRGAHGFKFSDFDDNGSRSRLIYTVFSAVDERGSDLKTQLGQVGIRVYGRQRMQATRLPVMWVTSPLGSSGQHIVPGGLQQERRLMLAANSKLPQNLRFYTDKVATAQEVDRVSPALENAVLALRTEQQELERDAQAGRVSLVPLWKRFGTTVTASVLAAGAAVVLFAVNRPHSEVSTPSQPVVEDVREKGGPGLHVFRQTATGAEEVISGAVFQPGDHVRFAVDLPRESRVAVIGVEDEGDVYTAWPPRAGVVSDVLAPGKNQILDGSVSLDDSRGKEKLYLVACTPASVTPRCESRGRHTTPICPVGCTLSPFVFDKGPMAP